MERRSTEPRPDDADTVEGVGELATLARILPRLPRGDDTLLGPGDDAAVVAAPDARFVVTTDLMVHGPDFRRAWSTPHDLGWKAAASNLSDVAAMGARPTALVVALAVPGDTPVTDLEDFADGLREGCAAMAPGTGVVGGDLSVSPTFTVAVTAFGDLEGRAPVRRDGARPGDVVAVSGALGRSARGLDLLFRLGVDHEGVPDAAAARALRDRDPDVGWHLAPTPPVAAGRSAARAGATAMLDLSDGLALDAGRVARASGVVIDLSGAELGDDPRLALGGGEDHTLFATFPPDVSVPSAFRVVGTVRDPAGGAPRVTVDGSDLGEAGGWDPYRLWSGAQG
ncbi:thiamine-phosphate kinase [Frigoribacterium sp. VKM Ac-2836]|uniref:thiamine-phosphate kinase n=1 Tax=Frigoribacterium sp. VKM Ac-2836 TaxID=2739014 RepID=UPI001564E0CA|nr:thiamine-phosphate kinase [Frigoribacterium sp. VKM Ac-2836]NRD25507.1 thiamine-phosphate kinase [Frigoribacterium sp. VKM Ac-2836]